MTNAPELLLNADAVPPALREWFARLDTPAIVTTLELLSDGRLLLRPLPGVSAELIAQLRVTLARYDEALMNLS